jgi:hypothetical protein
MPRRYTVAVMRDRARKRADKQNDRHISDSEWVELMSEVYGDLFHIVVEGCDRYFETTEEITADGSASYDEPDDHLSTILINRVLDAGSGSLGAPLLKLEPQERHFYAGRAGDAETFMLVDNQLFLYPKPSTGTYRWLYVPQPPDLRTYDEEEDLLDVVNVYGEQFLIAGVAALALSKSESDVRFHLQRQERAAEKLREWAIQRSQTDGHRRQTRLYDDDPDFPERYR